MCYDDRRIRYKSAGGKARARFLTLCPWYHHIGVFGYFAIALQKTDVKRGLFWKRWLFLPWLKKTPDKGGNHFNEREVNRMDAGNSGTGLPDRSISLREPVSDEIYTEQGTEFSAFLLFPD